MLASRGGGLLAFGVGTIFLGRVLGPSQFGILAAGGGLSDLVLCLGPFGVDQLMLARRVEERDFRSTLWLSAFASEILICVAAALWPGLVATTRLCAVLAGTAAVVGFIRMPYLLVPQFHGKFSQRARRELFFTLVMSGACLAALTHRAVVVALVTLALSAALTIAVTRVRPVIAPVRTWARVTKLGTPYSLSSALYTVYFQIDVVLVATLSTSVQTGLYRAAYAFVSAAVIIPIVLNNEVMRPKLYAMPGPGLADARQRLIRRFAGVSLGAGFVVALALYCARHVLVSQVFGSRYQAAAPLLALLAVALPFHYFNSWAGNVGLARGQTRVVLAIQGFVVVVNVVGNLVEIPAHGAKGAAVMTVVSEAACSLGYGGYLLISRWASRRSGPTGNADPLIGRDGQLALALSLSEGAGSTL
jgi:O-antigen/teichoic acid export membrane protein